MTYTKTAWYALTPRSARLFNHLESQYSEIKSDIDNHNHDTRYYPKVIADTTFYNTTFMGITGQPDADTLDGVEASALVTATMPVGAIMWWSGTDANVPNNWHICDGTQVGDIITPDLRGRFIVGAGGALDPGDTGGSVSLTPTASLTIAGHALTTAEIPAHTHDGTDHWNTSGYFGDLRGGPEATTATSWITRATATPTDGYGTAHGHAGSTITVSAISKLPKWKSYYLIEKVS